MTEEQRLTAEELEAIRERAREANESVSALYGEDRRDLMVVLEDIPRLLSCIDEQSRRIAALEAVRDAAQALVDVLGSGPTVVGEYELLKVVSSDSPPVILLKQALTDAPQQGEDQAGDELEVEAVEMAHVLAGVTIRLEAISRARGVDLPTALKVYDRYGANWQAGLEQDEQSGGEILNGSFERSVARAQQIADDHNNADEARRRIAALSEALRPFAELEKGRYRSDQRGWIFGYLREHVENAVVVLEEADSGGQALTDAPQQG